MRSRSPKHQAQKQLAARPGEREFFQVRGARQWDNDLVFTLPLRRRLRAMWEKEDAGKQPPPAVTSRVRTDGLRFPAAPVTWEAAPPLARPHDDDAGLAAGGRPGARSSFELQLNRGLGLPPSRIPALCLSLLPFLGDVFLFLFNSKKHFDICFS